MSRTIVITLILNCLPVLGEISFSLDVADATCPIGGEVLVKGLVTYTGDETIQLVEIADADPAQGLWSSCGSISCSQSDELQWIEDFQCRALETVDPDAWIQEVVGLTLDPGETFEITVAWVRFEASVPVGYVHHGERAFGVEAIVRHGDPDAEPPTDWEEYFFHGSADGSNQDTFNVTATEPAFRAEVAAVFAGGMLTLDLMLEAPAPAVWHLWIWPVKLLSIPVPAIPEFRFQLRFPFPAGVGKMAVLSILTTSGGIEDFSLSVFDT